MNRVFVIGSANMDLVIGAPRLPEMGETIHGDNFFTNPGGKGANQAVAAARAGAKTYFCGLVGEDLYGDTLADELKNSGVDISLLGRVRGCSSGVAVITVVQGDNCIVLDGGANMRVAEKNIDDYLKEAHGGDVLLIQQEIPSKTVVYALKKGKGKGMLTLLNPAPAQNFDKEALRFADIVLPNETEAAELSGGAEYSEAAEILAENGCTVIVTLGAQGCYIFADGRGAGIACPKVKAADTTAAGDTFCGYLAARLAEGRSLEKAVGDALAAASLAVTRRGAQKSIPFADEVEQFKSKQPDNSETL